MRAIAVVVHRIPRRVRLRIPSRRRDASFFEAVQRRIGQHARVHDLSVNHHTGSVVIHHSGELEDILLLCADLFELEHPDEVREQLATVAKRAGLPLPVILDGTAATSASLGVYQFVRRGDLGTASENFWAAFGSYRILQSAALAAAFAGLGLIQLLRGEWLGSAPSLLYYSLVAHNMAEVERNKEGAATP